MTSSPVIVATWPKNSRESFRVRIDTYRGSHVLDLRSWYDGGGGVLKPGRGGLTIGLHHLPALADALTKAVEVATATGLLKGKSA